MRKWSWKKRGDVTKGMKKKIHNFYFLKNGETIAEFRFIFLADHSNDRPSIFFPPPLPSSLPFPLIIIMPVSTLPSALSFARRRQGKEVEADRPD